MRYYRFPDNKVTKVCFFVFFFLMLYFTRTAMPASHLIGINTAQFIQLGLMCILGFAFLTACRRDLKLILCDKRTIVIVIATFIMLFPMLIKRDWQLMYFSILLGLLFAFFLTYFFSYREVAKYYVSIIACLALISLLVQYLIRNMVLKGYLSLPVLNYDNWYDYCFVGLAFFDCDPNNIRNYGIFREPGLYQFFLIVALYLNNYSVDWKNEKLKWAINIILSVTTATTFSTNGVAELVLFVVVLFFDKQYHKDKRVKVLAIVCLAGLAVASITAICEGGTLYRTLEQMITKIFTKTKSSTARYGSISVDLKLFLQSPVFGNKLATVLHAVEDNTCSTLILYAVHGVVGGTLNVVAWFSLVWEKERKLWLNLAYVLIIFMSFNTQNLIADIMFWLFPVMALTEKVVPWLERKLAK